MWLRPWLARPTLCLRRAPRATSAARSRSLDLEDIYDADWSDGRPGKPASAPPTGPDSLRFSDDYNYDAAADDYPAFPDTDEEALFGFYRGDPGLPPPPCEAALCLEDAPLRRSDTSTGLQLAFTLEPAPAQRRCQLAPPRPCSPPPARRRTSAPARSPTASSRPPLTRPRRTAPPSSAAGPPTRPCPPWRRAPAAAPSQPAGLPRAPRQRRRGKKKRFRASGGHGQPPPPCTGVLGPLSHDATARLFQPPSQSF